MARYTTAKDYDLRKRYVLTIVYLIATLLLGLIITFGRFELAECAFLMYLQAAVRNSLGILPFQVLTYLGDLYLWVTVAFIYLVSALLKSRKNIGSAVELVTFLTMVTILNYSLKLAFDRPRPNCPNLTVYTEEVYSAYPSGHVSRATGALLILLPQKKRTLKALVALFIFLVSISSMILGLHYLTDVIGAVFLSLAARNLANLSITHLRLTERLQRLIYR